MRHGIVCYIHCVCVINFMPLLQEELTLDADEQLVSFFRPHSIYCIVWCFFLALLLIALSLFMFKIFEIGIWGIIFFILLFCLLTFLFFSKVLAWYGTISILTSRRLLSIKRSNLIKKQVTEVRLQNVSELSYTSKGFIQTVFHFGNIHLTVYLTNSTHTIHNIPLPQKVMDMISAQIAKLKSMV